MSEAGLVPGNCLGVMFPIPALPAACHCNPYGTVNQQTSCNQVTGQCECLSHVTERDCSACEPGFFNLQSGRGCER